MHELSIALSMIDVAAEEAHRRGGGRVVAVHLRLGPLSGVVKEALRSSWDLACEHSPLEGSRLEIEDVPVVGYCQTCNGEHPAMSIQEMTCAACGQPMPEIVSGRELEVFALEIVDEAEAIET